MGGGAKNLSFGIFSRDDIKRGKKSRKGERKKRKKIEVWTLERGPKKGNGKQNHNFFIHFVKLFWTRPGKEIKFRSWGWMKLNTIHTPLVFCSISWLLSDVACRVWLKLISGHIRAKYSPQEKKDIYSFMILLYEIGMLSLKINIYVIYNDNFDNAYPCYENY